MHSTTSPQSFVAWFAVAGMRTKLVLDNDDEDIVVIEAGDCIIHIDLFAGNVLVTNDTFEWEPDCRLEIPQQGLIPSVCKVATEIYNHINE